MNIKVMLFNLKETLIKVANFIFGKDDEF